MVKKILEALNQLMLSFSNRWEISGSELIFVLKDMKISCIPFSGWRASLQYARFTRFIPLAKMYMLQIFDLNLAEIRYWIRLRLKSDQTHVCWV